LEKSNEIRTFTPSFFEEKVLIIVSMKKSELEKLLKQNGCYFVKPGKRHDRWHSPLSNSTFSVPRHEGKEIPIGTLNSILKQAGIE